MCRVSVQTNVLNANDEIAADNRHFFEEERTVVINLMSAPGAGKTALLEPPYGAYENTTGWQ